MHELFRKVFKDNIRCQQRISVFFEERFRPSFQNVELKLVVKMVIIPLRLCFFNYLDETETLKLGSTGRFKTLFSS